MSADRFRLGVAQITSSDQSDSNLLIIEKLYLRAVTEKADLVVFPENSLYFRIRSGESVRGLEWNGPEMARLQQLVDGHGVRL
ncbi:MAG: nitrilase-related carbon-nitrogen hydrolase, partial [Bdellovibrionales bacterium]